MNINEDEKLSKYYQSLLVPFMLLKDIPNYNVVNNLLENDMDKVGGQKSKAIHSKKKLLWIIIPIIININ